MSDDLLESLKMLVNQGKGDVRKINKIILKLDQGEELDEWDKDYVDNLDSLISKTEDELSINPFANYTDITDFEKLSEIEKIVNRLDEGEKVLKVVRQTKNPLKPGGSLFTPDTIFATTKKILIRNPSSLGLRHNIESYSYDQIVDVELEKGMLSSAIMINVPGSLYDGVIEAIPKDEAEDIVKIINEGIKKEKNPAPSDDDPLTILKKRYAKGEVSKEEFEQMRQDLENS